MSDSRLVAVLLALTWLAALPARADWDARASNPAPAERDFVLPMPCGGEMVFRRVEVPGGGPTADRSIALGGGGTERFKESPHAAFVGGTFRDPELAGSLHYFIGKYEVSRLQYEALAEDCPEASDERILPVTEVSWFDAVRFTESYNAWLMKNALERLPRTDRDEGQIGFVRLPTEAEWEYATRGGSVVTEAKFVDKVFPIARPGLRAYVNFNSPESAALLPIGSRKPNPLGLHDILGNAAEIALEPFHATQLARLHGQAGGIAVRGGSFFTPADEIRSAQREELPHYGPDGSANRRRDVGFRLVISAAAIPRSAPGLERFKADREKEDAAQRGLREQLEALDYALEDPELKGQVAELRKGVEALAGREAQQRQSAARNIVRTGAWIGQEVHVLQEQLRQQQARYDKAISEVDPASVDVAARASEQESELRKMLDRLRESLERARSDLKQTSDFYADTVVAAGNQGAAEELREQLDALLAEMKQRGYTRSRVYFCYFLRHTEAYAKTRAVQRDVWQRDLDAADPARCP